MNLTATVFFDQKLACYRVRLRGPGGVDIKKRVPAKLGKAQGVELGEPNPAGERFAWEWAVDWKREEESRTGSTRKGDAISLKALFELYAKRNPGRVEAITMKKNREQFAHLGRIILLPPDQIDSAAVLDYVAAREKEEAAPRSISNECRFLLHLLRHGYEWQRETGIATLQLHRLPKLPTGTRKGLALTVEQVNAMLANPNRMISTRVRRILVVGVATMLRRSVLLGLRWAWIDLKRGWLHIPASFMKGRGGQKKPLSVPLSLVALDAIGHPGRSEFVFSNRNGGRAWHFNASFKTLAKAAGVEHFTPHDLRRTGMTWLADAGIEERVIKILMGHSSEQNRTGQTRIVSRNVSDSYRFVGETALIEALKTFDSLIVWENHGKVFHVEHPPTRTGTIG